MNLIDFHVTKILEETNDKVYKLFGMVEDDVNNEVDESWKQYLLCNGIKQTYEYWDDGGVQIDSEIFNLDRYQKPFYAGYVGSH